MNNPKYRVLGYTETVKKPLLIQENLSHSQAWQLARKTLDENQAFYAISVKAMKGGDYE